MAAKAKSTEVIGLVPKDLGEISTHVEGAAETVGQQVEAAADAVKKTFEEMDDMTGEKSPSLISLLSLDNIQRTLSDLAEGLVVNFT